MRKSKAPAADRPEELSTLPETAAADESAAKSVAMLAQALATAQMYGVVHKVTGKMLEQGFPVLADGLAKLGKLTLTVAGGDLRVNGSPLASQGGQIVALARRMQALSLPSLTLNRGFGLPELEKLLTVLSAPAPAAGSPPLSAQALREAGLTHVSVQAAGTLRAIGEDERVVRRDAARRLHPGGAAPGGMQRGDSAALLEDALAFLRGSPADRDAPPGAGNALVDGRTLAQLLVEVGRALQPGGTQLPAADLRAILQRAARQSLAATVSAQRTLQLIEVKAREPAADTAKYRELIALIAELAQELSQPLTIVNATIDMIRRSAPADGNEGRSELLAMASESGTRLAELVTRLVQIAGTPESLSPDAERLKTIYRTGGT